MDKQVTMKQTEASLAFIVLPQDCNPGGTLHGGRYLTLLDETAYCAAMKFCRRHILTGQVDGAFTAAVRRGHLIRSHARVIHAGKSSMVVEVNAVAEDMREGKLYDCAKSYFTCVAVDDENLRPVEIPELVAETEDEQKLMQLGANLAVRFKENR